MMTNEDRLMDAALNGNLDDIKYLVKKGVNLNARISGHDALDYARSQKEKYERVIKYLEEA